MPAKPDPKPDDIITGTVQTDAQGSNVNFDICTREEWEKLDEDQQRQRLVEAMWESGMVDVYANT